MTLPVGRYHFVLFRFAGVLLVLLPLLEALKPAAAKTINSLVVASGSVGSHLPSDKPLMRCGPVAV